MCCTHLLLSDKRALTLPWKHKQVAVDCGLSWEPPTRPLTGWEGHLAPLHSRLSRLPGEGPCHVPASQPGSGALSDASRRLALCGCPEGHRAHPTESWAGRPRAGPDEREGTPGPLPHSSNMKELVVIVYATRISLGNDIVTSHGHSAEKKQFFYHVGQC